MVDQSALRLVENYVSSGTVVLLLGPNFCSQSRAIADGYISDFFGFPAECCNAFGLNPHDFYSDDEIIDYLTSTPTRERRLRLFMRERFGVKRPLDKVTILPSFVWRKIYSFDISDGVEVAYRMNHRRMQRLRSVTPDVPLQRQRSSGQTLELVKLNGDALSESTHNIFTNPSYKKEIGGLRRYNALRVDFEMHPVFIIADEIDKDFIFNEVRALRRTETQQRTVLICPGLKTHQKELISEQGSIYLDVSGEEFLTALSQAFPNGRSLDDIAHTTSGFSLTNKALQDVIAESFTVLTADKLDELAETPTLAGGIHPFYRGEHVQWADVVRGTHADLTPFKNWRNRISLELDKGFPFGKMFLLQSPAGMGKTVGLMATAYWLRQRSTHRILWLEPDGDLHSFLLRLDDEDFERGVFVVVDDIMNFIDAFEGISESKLTRLAFLCTSREARWNRYRRRLPKAVVVLNETLRNLNRADADELHSKISRYGTTVHFQKEAVAEQIAEILSRSRKDMLVLIRELGQGRKFDEIVRSEIGDLDEKQKFAYLLVCVTDRNQVPLPMDLFSHAFGRKFPEVGVDQLLVDMGRILERGSNRRTLRTRHSTIAQHVVERRNAVVNKGPIEDAIRCLLVAFSQYQIPILVHHSNTGHARVFKLIINRRFLAETLGLDQALGIYRDFEKTFELDGFFWQQYGLCQSQARDYEVALDTLRHAYAIHEHFQIKHSLGATSLTACAKLGREGLKKNDFGQLREVGRALLRELHDEFGYRDDLSISTLAQLDTEIANKVDDRKEFHKCCEAYHRELAFYVRDHPDMSHAKRSYERLNALLSTASTVGEPDYELLLDE